MEEMPIGDNDQKCSPVLLPYHIDPGQRAREYRIAMESEAVTTAEAARALIDRCEGVIFDNDGTLVDSMPAHYRAWSAAATANGLTFPEKQFYALAGKSAAEVLATLNKEQNKEVELPAIRAVKTAALAKERIDPIVPVVELARYAKAQGKRIAVASGGHRANVEKSLRGIGIEPNDFFHAVVTAEDVVYGKPNPEPFERAARLIGVSAERCVGFEDGDLGLQALKAAGMQAVDVRLFADCPLPPVFKPNKQ